MTTALRRLAAALCAIVPCIATLFASCVSSGTAGNVAAERLDTEALGDTLARIAASYPGEIGIAVIVDSRDTVAVNNRSIYPMMSVFKVHQALAVCHELKRQRRSLDTLLTIRRDALDPHTWSPMLKEHAETVMRLPVSDLLRYTLTLSDNNASNLLFERLAGVAQTDSFVATLIPRSDFRIAYTEAEMSADHAKAYANRTSPLGAAKLMDRLFTDSILSEEMQDFVTKTLHECATGTDRIAAPLLGQKGVRIAHKTGSGYTDTHGVLAAHNDVARVCLPNGTCYTLAVFVKDFHGNEAQASQAIARVSGTVFTLLSQLPARR